MADPAYGERAYRRQLAHLAATVTPCWTGCGRRATSPDHHPPLARHHHVPGTGCCQLLPSCRPCQSSQGARLRNRARPPATTSRRW